MSLIGMPLTQRALPLPIHDPIPPDSFICSSVYGRNIRPSFCRNLVDAHWPSGDTPVPFYLHDPAPSNAQRLPYTVRDPGCTVSIEAAGPNVPNTHYLTVAPNILRGLAGFLIQQCSVDQSGLGGFVSFGMIDVQTFVTEWGLRTSVKNQSNSGQFLTVSLYGNERIELQPGDTDPAVAGLLSALAALRLQNWIYQKSVRTAATQISQFLHHRAIEMTRGGNLTWWDNMSSKTAVPQKKKQKNTSTARNSQGIVTSASGKTMTTDSRSTMPSNTASPSNSSRLTDGSNDQDGDDAADAEDPGEMTYQCDSNLGAGPDPTDCEKLSWSGLKAPDSIEFLEADAPKFYTQGTCTLGISSKFSTNITWAHLLAAFDTLYNLCVQNPIQRAKGGRAYFGQQTMSSWISGKRDSVSGVSGLEALPAGINATIFQHNSGSSISCEWALIQEGKDITMCQGV